MFRFKQFTIEQDRTAMKVGTDGVLLGAWVEVSKATHRILDVGTGTGVIALMLAQRCPEAQITGVDIESTDDAQQNGEASPWSDRLHFFECPVQEFESAEPFDLVVSNPPYFVDSLLSPDAQRTKARHTVSLDFGELITGAERLLSKEGRLAVVLPVVEGERFIREATRKFYLTRRTEVKTSPRKPAKRLLLEFSKQQEAEVETTTLTIGTGQHETYTEEYRQLTGDFYLKF